MAFKFNNQAFKKIRYVYDRAVAEEVPWWAVYEEVSLLLGEALANNDEVNSEDLLNVKAAKLWFEGAVKVNKGEGAFSTFIREYTVRQTELRLGSSSVGLVVA